MTVITQNALSTAEREISAMRTFDAPRHLVWDAWTNPDAITQWWGPVGFTTTTKLFEFRPGGQWLHTMHGPDGTDYRNDIVFTSIVDRERIEYDHGPSPLFHVTVTFEDESTSRTKLTVRMLFPTREERDRTAEKFGAVEGLNQTLDRLGQFIIVTRTGKI